MKQLLLNPSSIFTFFNKYRSTKISALSVGFLCASSPYTYAKLTLDTTDTQSSSTSSTSTSTSTSTTVASAASPGTETTVNVLDLQRYTGSLLSPSGAVVQAGSLMLEPYFQSTISRGAYLPDGRVQNNKHRTDSANSFLLVKYGITNHLTVQVTPQVYYYWNGRTTSSSVHFSDLPVEFQYRWIDQVNSRYQPSLTTYLGMNFPTGDFNNLGRSLDGAGTGSYALRFGLQSQAAYKVYNRALRIRLWGVARKPLNSANLKNITAYGTDAGYNGNAKSGLFGNWGFSVEYGLTKEWVLAFDFQYDWAKGTRMRGAYTNGPFTRYVTGASHDIQVAPAIEYNPTPALGIIVGAALTVDGHNTNDFVQPQFAVNLAY